MTQKTSRLEYEVTHRCNLDCNHCYIDHNVLGEELTTKEGYHLIDDLTTLKIPTLHFTGGEPLLRKDIFELMTYSSDKLRTVLETNASLVDKTTAEKIIKTGIDSVTITLNDLNGVMRKQTDNIKNGIKNLANEGQKIMIHTDLCDLNKDQISDIMNFSNNIGAKYFLIRLVLPTEKSSFAMKPHDVLEIFKTVQKKKKEYENMTIIDDFLINEKIEVIPNLDPYGNIRPYAYTNQNIGNIREQPLGKLIEKAYETPIEGTGRIRNYLNEVQKFIQEH